MTATPAVTDRTGASDQEFADRVAAFQGAAAPESFDPIAALRRVEAVIAFVDACAVGISRLNAAAYTDIADRLRAALAPQAGEAGQ